MVTQKMGSTTCNKVIFADLFFQNAFFSISFFNFRGGGVSKAQYITDQSVSVKSIKEIRYERVKMCVTKKCFLISQ